MPWLWPFHLTICSFKFPLIYAHSNTALAHWQLIRASTKSLKCKCKMPSAGFIEHPGENFVKSTVSAVWFISRSDPRSPTSVSEQTALWMNEKMSGKIIVIVQVIICREQTLIEMSFPLIRHDPFLPPIPLPTHTYSIYSTYNQGHSHRHI